MDVDQDYAFALLSLFVRIILILSLIPSDTDKIMPYLMPLLLSRYLSVSSSFFPLSLPIQTRLCLIS